MNMIPKAGIISQARMTSTRLPGKILMEILEIPLLKYHVERLKWSKLPLFIATTVNKEDDIVTEFAKKEGVQYYRGSEDNVLSRYYECAKENQLDIIVRVTSDCPLIDGNIIAEAVADYIKLRNYNLYISNCLERTFPRGFDFEIFSFQMLEDAFKNATLNTELEHVTPYINQNKSGKIEFKHVLNSTKNEDIRITVDTPEDFQLIKFLIEEYKAAELDYKKIISIFENNPKLKEINAHIEQKKI